MAKKKSDLQRIFDEHVAALASPEARAKFWNRAQGALADVIDGGIKIGKGLLAGWRESGEHAVGDGSAALGKAIEHYSRLRIGLRNGSISAERFDASYRQIRETLETRFKTISEKTQRDVAANWQRAIDDGVGAVWKVASAVFGV